MGVLDMGVNVMSVRDSWKQHHHSLEAGERWGAESDFTHRLEGGLKKTPFFFHMERCLKNTTKSINMETKCEGFEDDFLSLPNGWFLGSIYYFFRGLNNGKWHERKLVIPGRPGNPSEKATPLEECQWILFLLDFWLMIICEFYGWNDMNRQNVGTDRFI